nr:MAG TPA: hypothetical protein [Caudoviricetes sp.]
MISSIVFTGFVYIITGIKMKKRWIGPPLRRTPKYYYLLPHCPFSI